MYVTYGVVIDAISESTFTDIQMVQGFVVNEVDLNPLGTCKENCGYYSYSQVYGCYQNQFCAKQRSCNGKLVNCQYIDSDMWICLSVSLTRQWLLLYIACFKIVGTKMYNVSTLKRRKVAIGGTNTSSTRTAWCTERRAPAVKA
jgi:hypothetical protein